MVKAKREEEHRNHRFMAALKGIDIDKDADSKNRFEEVERRAQARLRGVSEEKLEFEELGLDIEFE